MNRKQRRIQEAHTRQNGAGPTPIDQAALDRINRLLTGDIEPPNPFVAYMVQKTNEVKAALIALQQNIQQGEQQLAGMRQEALKLQGQVQKYVEDIRTWDKKLVDGGPVQNPEPNQPSRS